VKKSLQTSTGWFDLHSDGLWHSGLAAAGASAELLPELLECGAPAGSLLPGPAAELGLPPNIPVVAGAMTRPPPRLPQAARAPGTVTETTGTALVMAACTGRSHVSQRAPRNRLTATHCRASTCTCPSATRRAWR
jgi:sugar (pentulose or hexulose) kinase